MIGLIGRLERYLGTYKLMDYNLSRDVLFFFQMRVQNLGIKAQIFIKKLPEKTSTWQRTRLVPPDGEKNGSKFYSHLGRFGL